jgi:hypothetical protein
LLRRRDVAHTGAPGGGARAAERTHSAGRHRAARATRRVGPPPPGAGRSVASRDRRAGLQGLIPRPAATGWAVGPLASAPEAERRCSPHTASSRRPRERPADVACDKDAGVTVGGDLALLLGADDPDLRCYLPDAQVQGRLLPVTRDRRPGPGQPVKGASRRSAIACVPLTGPMQLQPSFGGQ